MDGPPFDYRQLEIDLESGLTSLESRLYPGPKILGLAYLAAATAAGDRHRLRFGLKRARRIALSPRAVRETLLQTYLFAGYPRAINALSDFGSIFPTPEPSGTIDLDPRPAEMEAWVANGSSLCRRVYGARFPKLLETMARVSPELGRWMVMEGYGKVLSRDGLSVELRELTAVAALIPLSVPAQLRAHLRGALLVGARREAVEGTIDAAALVSPENREPAHRLLERVVDDDLQGE